MAWKLGRLRLSPRRRIALFAALMVLALFLLLRQRCRFGEEQFAQLREGMTEAEVVAILGSPPGDYRPAIWSEPDWFVSNSHPIGSLLKERGRSLLELEELKRQDVEEWRRAGYPVLVVLHNHHLILADSASVERIGVSAMDAGERKQSKD